MTTHPTSPLSTRTEPQDTTSSPPATGCLGLGQILYCISVKYTLYPMPVASFHCTGPSYLWGNCWGTETGSSWNIAEYCEVMDWVLAGCTPVRATSTTLPTPICGCDQTAITCLSIGQARLRPSPEQQTNNPRAVAGIVSGASSCQVLKWSAGLLQEHFCDPS